MSTIQSRFKAIGFGSKQDDISKDTVAASTPKAPEVQASPQQSNNLNAVSRGLTPFAKPKDDVPMENGSEAELSSEALAELARSKQPDDEDDSDMDLQETQEEIEERRRLLAEGAKAATEVEDVPEELKKVYAQTYPLIQRWWTKREIPKTQKNILNRTNKKIVEVKKKLHSQGRENKYKELLAEKGIDANSPAAEEARAEMERQFEDWAVLPFKSIEGQIQVIGEAWDNVLTLKKAESRTPDQNAHLARQTERLIDGCLVFQTSLKSMGLDPLRLIPVNVQEQFFNLVAESEENGERVQAFMDFLAKPASEEQELWEVAHEDIHDFITIVSTQDLNQDNANKMLALAKSMEPMNKSLSAVQKSLHGEVTRSKLIPVEKMGDLATEVAKGGENTDIRVKLQELLRILEWCGQREFVKGLPVPTTAEVPVPAPSSEEANKMVIDSTPTSSGHGAVSTAAAEAIDAAGAMDAAGAFPMDAQGAFPMDAEGAFPMDAEGAFFMDEEGVISVHRYKDGMTEYGPLEAVRPTTSLQATYSRFIVNSGTEKLPFFRVVRGSDFGEHGAKALNNMKGKHTRFRLAERKQAGYDAGHSTVQAIGPYIQLPRANPGKESAKRLDTYVRVKYYTDREDNPLAGERDYPSIEWLNRTEIMGLVGKKFFEKREPFLLAHYKKMQEHFDTCRKQRIHPETRKPLTDEDKKSMPWLWQMI